MPLPSPVVTNGGGERRNPRLSSKSPRLSVGHVVAFGKLQGEFMMVHSPIYDILSDRF